MLKHTQKQAGETTRPWDGKEMAHELTSNSFW